MKTWRWGSEPGKQGSGNGEESILGREYNHCKGPKSRAWLKRGGN